MKALAALVLLPAFGLCQEETVAIADIPGPVRNAVMARFADATIKGASRDKEAGKTIYEVSLDRAGRNIDVTTTSTGQLTLIESEIARADLPAAVGAQLEARYPGATYQILEEVRAVKDAAESLSFYEVLLVDARKELWEVQVSVNGSRIINVERKKPAEPE